MDISEDAFWIGFALAAALVYVTIYKKARALFEFFDFCGCAYSRILGRYRLLGIYLYTINLVILGVASLLFTNEIK